MERATHVKRRTLLAAPLAAWAADARAQTVDALKKRGKLSIAVLIDDPPYGSVDEDGKPQGIDIDVARLLAQRMGVPLDMVTVTGPNRIPYLLTGKVDILAAALGIVPERAKIVTFSHPYSGFSTFLYGKKDVPMRSFADLKGLSIGVPRANTADLTISKKAPPGTEILRFDDDASVQQALLSGQVDAVSASVTSMPILEKLAGPGRFERKFDVQTQVNGIAVRPGQTELLAWVNDAVDAWMKDGQLAAIYRKWAGFDLPDLSQTS